ncbi:MAG: SDR family oxidoreductase [Anaerolineales bacterium]
MRQVVITGSTRGLGYGMAESFLARGCSVTVSGRSKGAVDSAIKSLGERIDTSKLLGVACDVRVPDELENLWKQTSARFGEIDIWINNAGISGSQKPVWKLATDELASVVDTNVLGLIFGSQVAVRGMLAQNHGAIYSMEGMGSDGRMHDGLITYGMTKYAVDYFTEALVKELKGTPLIIGSLRPGMLATEFITNQYVNRPDDWEKDKKILNIIASRIETVAPWLVDKILTNQKSGVCISYSSRSKLFMRFLTAPFSKRIVFDDE